MYIKNNTLDTAWHKSLSGLQKILFTILNAKLTLATKRAINSVYIFDMKNMVGGGVNVCVLCLQFAAPCCEEPTVIACTDEVCLSMLWIVCIKLTDCSYFWNRHFVVMLSFIKELEICIWNKYDVKLNGKIVLCTTILDFRLFVNKHFMNQLYHHTISKLI